MDVLGVSWKKAVEIVLTILAVIFFIVDKQNMTESLPLISIMVLVYLCLVIFCALNRRADSFGAGSQIALESVFGVILLWLSIQQIGKAKEGLDIAAVIMDMIVGAMFLLFTIF